MTDKANAQNGKIQSVKEAMEGKKQCPACGKQVDKDCRICPECTAQFRYRVKESTLVKFSLIFIALGVVYFLIAAYWQAPITNIDELDKDDNFSIMRFEGKVVRTPRYYPSKYQDYGEMKFYINDTTGDIQVLCGSKVTEELIGTGNIPALGDTVEVLGRVLYIGSGIEYNEVMTITEDGINVYLDQSVVTEKTMPFMRVEVMYEDNIKITGRSYSPKDISDVAGKPGNTFESGKKVMMSGTVVSEVTNFTTSYQVTIGDLDSGDKVLVYVPKDLVELAGIELYSEEDILHNLRPGSEVTILGALEYYESSYGAQHSKWELIPTSVGDKITVKEKKDGEIIEKTCFEVTSAGEGFTVDMLMSNPEIYKDEDVLIQGVRIVKSGGDTYVEDLEGEYPLLVYGYRNLSGFKEGDIVDISGTFFKYTSKNGEIIWEIKGYDSEDIQEVV